MTLHNSVPTQDDLRAMRRVIPSKCGWKIGDRPQCELAGLSDGVRSIPVVLTTQPRI